MNFRTKLTVVLSTSMLLFAACENQQTEEVRPTLPQLQIPNASQLNATLLQRFADQGSLNWQDMEDGLLYSALKESNYVLSIGYKQANHEFTIDQAANFRAGDEAWTQARTLLLSDITDFMGKNGIELPEQLVLNVSPQFANMELYISNPLLLNYVRNHPLVRYAEANFYEVDFNGEAKVADSYVIEEPCLIGIDGEPCDFDTDPDPISPPSSSNCYTPIHLDDGGLGCGWAFPEELDSRDYTVIPSGTGTGHAKKSWVLDNIGMTSYAWSRGNAGAGIGVALIDTGISPNQCNLAYPKFNSGGSISTRIIEKKKTYGNNVADACGHGTEMAALIAAPRTESGTVTGAAYNCNLYSYKANEDAYINVSSQVNAIAAAIKDAANNSDVRIISISQGSAFDKSAIKEAIEIAYSKGKLIVCAAGTSFARVNGVAFPARMWQTISVTGRETGDTNKACDRCHYGLKVDFSVVMQRRLADGRTAPCIAEWGDNNSYVSGSSSATAITAGALAVIWAAHPYETAQQIRQRLIRSAENQDHSDPKFGYGNYNVHVAIL